MKILDINRNWTLQKGEPSSIPGMPVQKTTVHLPHDYMIAFDVTPHAKNGVNGGCYPGDTMSYTKMLDIPAQWRDRRVLVRFDGCSGQTKIVVNGHVAGHHHYGYTPFAVDMTPYLVFGGQNRLTITAGTDLGANSRWYSGGGLYRHVQLLTGPKVHLAVDAIYAHLDHMVDGDALLFLVGQTLQELRQRLYASRHRNFPNLFSPYKDPVTGLLKGDHISRLEAQRLPQSVGNGRCSVLA